MQIARLEQKTKGRIIMRKKLVAFFSASVVTRAVAKRLADGIHADIVEIQPTELYSKADLDWTNASSRSSIEMKDPASRPTFAPVKIDTDDYDTVFIGFPIWWYVAPHIINSFLEAYDMSGKTVVPFATSGGSGMGKTNEALCPSCNGANLAQGRVFPSGVSEDQLADWAKGFCR